VLCTDGNDNDNDGLVDCEDPECFSFFLASGSNSCELCGDGLSFGDVVLGYESGCPISDSDVTGALGVNDFVTGTDDRPAYVFLGDGGFIEVGFTNNLLTNSGNSEADLWVFEVGPLVEATYVLLRPFDTYTKNILLEKGISQSGNYFEFGLIAGSTSFIDIDTVVGGFSLGDLKFDAVRLVDLAGDNDICDPTNIGPGADIDAICAITSTAMISPPIISSADSSLESNFTVFPNPTSNYIHWSNKELSFSFVQVFSLSGKKVHSAQPSNSKLYLGDLKPGIYLVNFISANTTVSRRVVVQ